MGKLIVKRSSEFMNKGRSIGLYLDDKQIDTIKNGETKEFELSPGNYNLTSKIDWCKSQTLQVNILENKSTTVELSGFTKKKWIFPVLFLIHILIIVLTYITNINSNLILIFSGIILMYVVFPITFGRNHYLKLNLR